MITIKECLQAKKFTVKDFPLLDFTEGQYYLATPKMDGRRVLKIGGKTVSKTFKDIRNIYTAGMIVDLLPDNADGEVTVGTTYGESGAITRVTGEPLFTLHWFDWVCGDELNSYTYEERLKRMDEWEVDMLETTESHLWEKHVKILRPTKIASLEELIAFEEKCIDAGFEGICWRKPDSPYKFGRGTMKEQQLFKLKRFEDSEALITGLYEEMENTNPKVKNAVGRSVRSTKKEGMIPKGRLGGFHCKDIHTNIEFDIGGGKGLTHALRQEVWGNQEKWIGKIMVYEYFAKGGYEKPRHPNYKGLRDKDDILPAEKP